MTNLDRIPSRLNPFVVAWALALLFYVLEYATRSAPAVMLPQLANAFGRDITEVGTLLGAYYYSYSVMSLVSGTALDKLGAKFVVALGCAALGAGCFVFVVPGSEAGYVGRLLQGAGSSFAFTGAVYLASRGFSAKSLATAIGATQCMGMLGGSAGQFLIGPAIGAGIDWRAVWIVFGVTGMVLAALLFLSTPGGAEATASPMTVRSLWRPYRTVLSNPQTYLCGLVAGLLFVPTTIGDMTWGVSFFEHDAQMPFSHAVMVISMVPLGWAVGCPLLGWLADSLGARKPALIGGAVTMLALAAQIAYAPSVAPPALSLFVFGVGSGAAMIPYTIVKEINPDEVKGCATGVMNFLVFGMSAAIGPIFGGLLGSTLETAADRTSHFRHAGLFWLACILLAIVASLFLSETGHRASRGRMMNPQDEPASAL